MKKRILSLLLAVTLLISFGGCSSASESTETGNNDSAEVDSTPADAAEEEPVSSDTNIVIWLAGNGEVQIDNAYREVFDKFAESKGISYELTFIPWSDYFTKLNAGLIGGAGPDIYMLGYGQMGSVMELGYVQNLDEYIPENWDGLEDIAENVLDAGRSDGSLYALFAPATRTFMYRTDIAEQQGLTEDDLYIKTPEDFYELVRKLTVYDEDGNVTTHGFEFDQDGEQFFYTLTGMYTDDVKLWDLESHAAFNTPEAVESINAMKALIDEGVVLLSAPGSNINGVQAGTAAMTLVAESSYATANSAFEGNIGFIKSDMHTLLIGNYTALNTDSKQKDIAAEMLFDSFSKESSSILAEQASMYSARKSLDEEFLTLNPAYENVLHAYSNATTFSDSFNSKYTEVVVAFRLGLEQIYAGADAQEHLVVMEDEWNATIG